MPAETRAPTTVDVDAVVRQGTTANAAIIESIFAPLIASGLLQSVRPGEALPIADTAVGKFLAVARVCDLTDPRALPGISADNVRLHLHALHPDEVEEAPLDEPDLAGGGGGGETQLAACHVVALPNEATDGQWESLVFDADIKSQLLRYARTALLMSRHRLDPNLVSLNRMILLHGPPGTGKTSLCKALAHKLSVRLTNTFRSSDFVEVNAHSLFSRWFSESGKQVMLLFQRIREMADDPTNLVCVLVDEVESLASARKSALSGSEPSDSIRVVNALLTQLDALRRRPNVLILATSNITESIDVAFIDRADLKILLPPPSVAVQARIVTSSVMELLRADVLRDDNSAATGGAESDADDDASQATPAAIISTTGIAAAAVHQHVEAILTSAGCADVPVSGRTLRKLPMLAFVHGDLNMQEGCAVPLSLYFPALAHALTADLANRRAIASA